jgi:hypothetical protein
MDHEFIASVERGVLHYSNIFLIDGRYFVLFYISEDSLTTQSVPGYKVQVCDFTLPQGLRVGEKKLFCVTSSRP